MTKISFVLLAGVSLATISGARAAALPAPQQNAIIAKYCTVCHDDAHQNGGLSLQHFDAARLNPGVAEMVLAKLTNGMLVAGVKTADTDPAVGAAIDNVMKSSAIHAAGLPTPDNETLRALVSGLAAESAGYEQWIAGQQAGVYSASIAEELPSQSHAGRADSFRLIVSCNAETHAGAVQLAWSPGDPDKEHRFTAAADAKPDASYIVTGEETMGTGGKSGPGAILLSETKALPKRTLTIRYIMGDDTIVFHFDNLPKGARKSLAACF